MSFSIHPSLNNAEPSSSYESSSSLKGLNLPPIPSPLHKTRSDTTTGPLSPKAGLQQDAFFDYPHSHSFRLTAHQAEIVAQSPLKNRQAPPPPPPPLAPMRRTSRGLVDDDDSLVFKMSELSADYEDEEDHSHKTNRLRRINSSGNLSKESKMKVHCGHYSDEGTSGRKPSQRLYFDDI